MANQICKKPPYIGLAKKKKKKKNANGYLIGRANKKLNVAALFKGAILFFIVSHLFSLFPNNFS